MSFKTTDPHPQHAVPAHLQEGVPAQTQQPPGIESKMTPRPDYGLESYKGKDRLTSKIALVTGGDSGIGRAVCLAFAREGCDIVCCYLNEHSDAKEIQEAVEKSGKQCLLLAGDISDDKVCKELVDKAVAKFGRVDILVNNAAYQGKACQSFEELTHERVLHTFKTNIISMFSLCHYAIPHIPKGGSIINTASIQAYQPSSHILDYATTKGAIINFTKGLAPQLIDQGIRVNCVAPGPVWTPLIVQSFPAEKVKDFGCEHPMGRPAQPVEIAPAFVFLASSDANYVNGEVMAVTGGIPTM